MPEGGGKVGDVGGGGGGLAVGGGEPHVDVVLEPKVGLLVPRVGDALVVLAGLEPNNVNIAAAVPGDLVLLLVVHIAEPAKNAGTLGKEPDKVVLESVQADRELHVEELVDEVVFGPERVGLHEVSGVHGLEIGEAEANEAKEKALESGEDGGGNPAVLEEGEVREGEILLHLQGGAGQEAAIKIHKAKVLEGVGNLADSAGLHVSRELVWGKNKTVSPPRGKPRQMNVAISLSMYVSPYPGLCACHRTR